MHVTEFNALTSAEAVAALRACADVTDWAQAVADARPFPSGAAALAFADELSASWSTDQVEAALADHPRLGEKHQGTGESADASAREQATLRASADPGERLAAGNRAYEERFGRVFLVRAAGRTAADVLEILEDRLTNDPADEIRVVAGELREICALRLATLLEVGAVSEVGEVGEVGTAPVGGGSAPAGLAGGLA